MIKGAWTVLALMLVLMWALIIRNEMLKPELEKELTMPEFGGIPNMNVRSMEVYLGEVDVRRMDSLSENIERLVEGMERLTKALEESNKPKLPKYLAAPLPEARDERH